MVEFIAMERKLSVRYRRRAAERLKRRRTAARGFSLVELVIVIVIIGVVAAIAIPRFSRASANASVAAVTASVVNIQKTIDIVSAENGGSVPPDVLGSWFPGGQIPANPMADSNQRRVVQVATSTTTDHPTSVVVSAGAAGYWYNRATGNIRARITRQDTAAATQALYQRVNGVPSPIVDGDGTVMGTLEGTIEGAVDGL